MAHGFNTEGKVSFATTKKAWHGLGTVLDKPMTAEEAIREASLDYEVIKVPTYANIGDAENMQEIETGHFANVRTDTNEVLGNVGKGYTILQNKDAFKFFDPIVERGEAIYETAGALGKGERTFLTAKMPEHIQLANGDLIENYIVFTNTHDGTGAVKAMVTPVRVVCANTLAASVSRARSTVNIRHTANLSNNLMEAHKILGLSSILIQEMEEMGNHMIHNKVNDFAATEIIARFLAEEKEIKELNSGGLIMDVFSTRKKNQLEAISDFYHTGVGQENVIGTKWGVYNAITGWNQHIKKGKDASRDFTNVVMGNTREKALGLCQ